MKELNRLFEKFYKTDRSDIDRRSKLCFRIMKILVKKPFMLVWSSNEGAYNEDFKNYYSIFRSSNGASFIIGLGLVEDESHESCDYIRYEFGVRCNYFKTNLCHIIHGVNFGKSAVSAIMFKGIELSLRYGYLIMELHNRVANQLQAVEMINYMRKELDTLKEKQIV